MTTEAGKRLLSIGGEFRWPRPDYAIAEAIVAIEAEGGRLARAQIASAVRGLEGACHCGSGLRCNASPCVENVSREEVLAIVDES